MVQIKCNGCNSYFKGNWGLSNHFQFNNKCKTIHLQLNNSPKIINKTIVKPTGGKTRKKLLDNSTIATIQTTDSQVVNVNNDFGSDTDSKETKLNPEVESYKKLPDQEVVVEIKDAFLHT